MRRTLPAYGCCCLGSINLTPFVSHPFTPKAHFDFESFAKVTKVAVRMLDNVLDATVWPLPQQKQEAHDKRRIGLGFTGLGDALIMLGLRYDTEEARSMAARIAEHMRDEAYSASVDGAGEGCFPCSMRRNIWPRRLARGCRNAEADDPPARAAQFAPAVVAPTGTISLPLHKRHGIEPPSWGYQSKKRTRAAQSTTSRTTPGACTATSAATSTSCRRSS